MSATVLNFTVKFETEECLHCHAQFAVTAETRARFRDTHNSFWCPCCGKTMHYPGKNAEEKLREELEAERRRKANILAEANQLRERNAKLGRRLTAQRGATKRLSNRVKNGVCPCCTRSFTNLREHMKTKHPDYSAIPA